MSRRERVTYDKLGTPQKTYKSDSWDDSKTVNDLSGSQRSPDANSPAYSEADSVEDQVYYTLGPSGMIDSFVEQMEQIKWDTGSKLDAAGSDTISGKMFYPNHGFGAAMWQGGIWLPFMPAPPGLIPPLPGGTVRTPPSSASEQYEYDHGKTNWVITPSIEWDLKPVPARPNCDPGFNPKPYYGPGSDRMSADFMGSSAYNNPNFGLPSDSGGSFIGLGRFDSACNIPNDMQPDIPSGGLFGPDFGVGPWGFPGYDPDWRHVPGGWIYTPDLPTQPLYFFPDDMGMLELPSVSVGARPSLGFSNIGKNKVIPYSEVLAYLIGDAPVLYKKIVAVPRPKPEPEKESEKEEEQEDSKKKKSGLDYLLEELVGYFALGVAAVVGAVCDALDYVAKGLDALGGKRTKSVSEPANRYENLDPETKARMDATGGEEVVHERTGLWSFKESKKKLPPASERAAHYERQRVGANRERAAVAVLFTIGVLLTIYAGASGAIGSGLRSLFGESWYSRCLRIRRTGNGWSFGRSCRTPSGQKWPWRIDYEPGKRIHYHRRWPTDPKIGQTPPGGGIGRHRPWDPPPPEKPWWWRF